MRSQIRRLLLMSRRMYSEPRVQDARRGSLFTEHFTAPHICASCCRSPHVDSCGWCMCGSLLVGFMNLFLSVSLSLSVCVAGPDRPPSSHMTTHTLGSSTTPTGNTLSAFSGGSSQRRLTARRTGHEPSFVLHFFRSSCG